MSFLTSLFRSPKASSIPADAEEEDDKAEESEKDESEEDEYPLPIPTGFSSGMRDRSLSRVFNELPQDIPDLHTIQLDVLEYMCHLVLHESDHNRMLSHKNQLVHLLQQHREMKKYGRFYSRFLLTTAAADILTTPIEGSGDGSKDDDLMTEWTPELWQEARQNLQRAKDNLLRQDADLLVPTFLKDGDIQKSVKVPKQDKKIDEKLSKHEMFTDQFPQVLLYIRVQESLSELCFQIEDGIESARETFLKSLKQIFGNGDESIPDVLSQIIEEDDDRIITKIESLLTDICNEYSLTQLQKKTRSLLTKWSESILTTPTLVRLGYGGVMAPIEEPTGDEDDISAFSGKGEHDEDNFLTQVPMAGTSTCSSSRRSSLKRHPVSSKDLRRVARQNIAAEEEEKKMRQQGNSRSDDFPSDDDNEGNSENEKENVHDPDEDKTLAQLRDENTRTEVSAKKRKATTMFDDDSDIEEYASCYSPNKWISHHAKRRRQQQQHQRHQQRAPRTPPSATALWNNSPVVADGKSSSRTPTTKSPISGHKKRPFSKVEAECIRDGFDNLGAQWAAIRDMHPALSTRSGQAIRDKYRTMVRKGEI